MVSASTSIPAEDVEQFCQRHHIQRLSFFEPVLRDEAGHQIDMGVLVEFETGHTPGLAFFAMEEELTKLLRRRIELNTLPFLSPLFRDKLSFEVQYVAGR